MKIPLHTKISFLITWPLWVVALLSIATIIFTLNMVVGITKLFVKCAKDWVGYLDVLNICDYYKQKSVWYEIKYGHEIYVPTPKKLKPIELKDDKETTNDEQNIR